MRRLILFISVLCVILCSCGGEPIENTNYTHYNIIPTTQTTTTTALQTTASSNATQSPAPSAGNTKAETEKAGNSAKPSQTKTVKKAKATNKAVVISETPKGSAVLVASTSSTESICETFVSTKSNRAIEQSATTEETTQTTTLAPLKDTDICYITANGEKYHREGCRYLAKSCIEIIVADAKEQGYTPCKVCKP